MFKIESYIAPILLSYVDKYIKNLKPEDLQLSLWGGDLVLNKLDLKLDVLERELNLPISFVSGHIHELRIHVPWHKLVYEPVIVTINTIECVLKLRDAADSDHGSTSSKSSSTQKGRGDKRSKVKKIEQEDVPPSYIQTLVNRVINNVNIVVNNLILKYVEDDIVLSVNVKSLESFSVDSNWERAFIELAQPDLVLRRIFELSDITVCLDKRNASGKIDMYQEPLLYKCSVTCRMHMTFDSINAKRASVIKINTMCEKLDISISDTQLPMYIRLNMLLLALYYGEIGSAEKETMDEDEKTQDVARDNNEGAGAIESTAAEEEVNDEGQGWASWAWSYVPQLVMVEDEEELESYQQGRHRKKSEPPVLVLGFYFVKSRVTFKLTDVKQDTPYYGPQKVIFNPFLCLEVDGAAIEVVYKGDPFFNAQIGFTNVTIFGLGHCACDLPDFQDGHHQQPFVTCGDFNADRKQLIYTSGSLFDGESPENNKKRTQFIFDVEEHQMKYSETLALQRFGAFWLDYLYTMEVREDEGSKSSRHSEEMQYNTTKETSSKKFLFGSSSWNINSSAIHRLQKFIFCANDHEYEPYSKPREEIVDENRPVPTNDEVSALEEFIPIRSTHFTALAVNVIFSAAEHPQCNIKKKKVSLNQRKSPRKEMRRKPETGISYLPSYPLPACQVQADRIDIQNTVPMYGRRLVKAVSKLPQPSGNLLHHCYSHMYINHVVQLDQSKCDGQGMVFGCQVALTTIDPAVDSPVVLNILPSCSAAVYMKNIKLPMYWTNPALVKSESLVEIPHLGVNATRAQLSLLQAIHQSWLQRAPDPSQLLTNTLMEDIFKPSAKSFLCGQPVLDCVMNNLEVKYSANSMVQASSGTVGSVMVAIHSLESGKASTTPLFYGPVDTTGVHSTDYYKVKPATVSDSGHQDYSNDLITFTAQIPRDRDDINACGVSLVDIKGTSLCLDPILYTWLTYQPREKTPPLITKQDSCVTLTTVTTAGSKSQEQMHTSSQGSSHSGSLRLAKQSESHSLSQPIQSPSSETTQDGKTDKKLNMTESVVDLWTVVKLLSVQVEIQCCSIYLPSTHMHFNTEIHRHNIPQAFQAAMQSPDTNLPRTVVVCLPTMKVVSAGHKAMSPLQEIPLDRMDVPVETVGDKLPWSTSFTNFSCYTLLDSQRVYYLVKPMAVTSTVAVSTVGSSPSSGKTSLGLCVHADMQAVVLNCSNKQVNLLHELATIALSTIKALTWKQKTEPPTNASTVPKPDIAKTTAKGKRKTTQSATSSSAVEADPAAGTGFSTGETGTSTGLQTESLEEDAGGNSGQPVTKVSLWLQWTVPKLSVNLYGTDPENQKREIKVTSELEDLSTSIDVQDIYSKVKCKVGAVNVNHYNRSGQSGWQAGIFNGIILSCTEKISTNTGVIKQPTVDTEQTGLFKSPFATTPLKSQDSTGFLSVTFTRALAKSVRQKMFGAKSESGRALRTKPRNCVNEICLNMQPYDVVLWCPVISAVMHVFAIEKHSELGGQGEEVSKGQSIKGQRAEVTIGTLQSESSVSKKLKPRKKKTAELTSSRNLPLLYLNMCEFRLFVPCGKSKPEPKCNFDTFLVQVNAINITPHADNPLSRLVLKKDIYRHAVHAGILQQPGSEVEDRQYQLDVSGLSLCTVSWEELISSERGKGFVTHGSLVDELTMGQNPALEWNTAVARKSPQGIHLRPIVLGFDIRTVVAPAVVCDKPTPDGSSTETITVCGHSLEVNLTSDMEVYLSTDQVHLAQAVLKTNVGTLMKSTKQEQTARSDTGQETRSRVSEEGRLSQVEDSGLGSESSTVLRMPVNSNRRGKQLVPQMATVHERPRSNRSVAFTPFDVLLTAGKLSVMLYSVEDMGSDAKHDGSPPSEARMKKVSGDEGVKASRPPDLKLSVTPNTRVHIPRTRSPIPGENPRRERTSSSGDDCGQVLNPFLYTVFMQPHTIVSMETQQQRVEMSCYDITVKGRSANYENKDITKVLPEPTDYGMDWLETCHGEPDAKTGILPSLYTLTIRDFMFKPADIKLNIGRPLKLNLSITKLQEVMEFIKELSPPKVTEVKAKLSPMKERPPEKGEISSNGSSGFIDMAPSQSTSEEGCDMAPSQNATGEPADVAPPQSTVGVEESSHPGVFPIIIPMPSAGDAIEISSTKGKGSTNDSPRPTDSMNTVAMVLTHLDKVSFRMCEFVIVAATVPDPSLPHVTFSLGGIASDMEVRTRPNGLIREVYMALTLKDAMVKTSLEHKTRPLFGPVTTVIVANADWCNHSGTGQLPDLPQISMNIECGLIQLHLGQGHLNCLELMAEHVKNHLKDTERMMHKKDKTHRRPSGQEINLKSSILETMPVKDEILVTTDDLRVGTFQYINDKDGLNLQPKPNEIVFCSSAPDSYGTMTWCYDEPRVLTYVAVNPVPFTTSVGTDVRKSGEDTKQIPCTLEYWDNLKKSFMVYRDLYISESYSYEVDLPDVKESSTANQIVAAHVWRVVLNAGNRYQEDDGVDDDDDEEDDSSELVSSSEAPISPMALAACMRVDSCFAAKFVPALSATVNFNLIQVRLSNHLQCTGQAQPKKLLPFNFDRSAPTDQEVMTLTLEGSTLFLTSWQGVNSRTNVQMSSLAQCELLEYRNLTMQPLIEPFEVMGSVNAKAKSVEMYLQTEPVFIRVSQSSVHTLSMTLQAWNQNKKPDMEEQLFNYYVICNDTQETLRLGQVSTDEAIVLESRQMHAYSWRTHKSQQQLHVCVEGWGNWKWSESFSIDEVGTTVHTLQHQGKTATLFVEVKALSPLQKQITISGKQYFSSRLSKDLEVQLIKVTNVGGKIMQSQQTLHLPAKTTIPSCICEDDAITGVRVRLTDVSCDWSEQFAISGEMSRTNTLIKIPCTGGKHIYIWCSIYEEKHAFTVQRVIVVSPLFVVRSHLPRPVIMNVETTKMKSVRHFNVIQRGHNMSLYDIEPELWHYLTFQLSAKASLSHPPVSISTQQIDKIFSKNQDRVSIHSLCYDWQHNVSEHWPYNSSDYDSSMLTVDNKLSHTVNTPTVSESDLPDQLPNIDLKVDLSQCWSLVNTLLIDVKPWCLLVNQTNLEINVLEEDEVPLVVRPSGVITPQNFKGKMSLGIGRYTSQGIELLKEPLSPQRRFSLMNKSECVLPLEGVIHTSIVYGEKSQQICHLVVASTVKHGIRVLTIKDRYLLMNKSKEHLAIRTVTITNEITKLHENKLNMQINDLPARQSSSTPAVQPIEFWDIPTANQSHHIKEAVQYLSFTYANEDGTQSDNQVVRKWTKFVALNPSMPRQSVAMPTRTGNQSGQREDPLAYAVTVIEHHGVVYVTVDQDLSPRIMIHNNCPFPLHFGQGLAEPDPNGIVTVIEETEILSSIPLVEANSAIYYEFPHLGEKFPELSKPLSLPGNLHISMAKSADTVYVRKGHEASQLQNKWTDAIDIRSSESQKSEIMVLPHCGYVLVNCKTVGTCTHVFVEPLTMEGHKSEKKITTAGDMDVEQDAQFPNPECSILVSQICLILTDELQDPVFSTEVLRLTLDNLHLTFFPSAKSDQPSLTQQCLQLSVASAQVDNQLFLNGSYDFPVLLLPQERNMYFRGMGDYFFEALPVEKLAEKSFKTSLFAMKLVFEIDKYRSASCIQELSVTSKPLTVYLEDQFIYQMLKVIDSYKLPHGPKPPIRSSSLVSHDGHQPIRWEDIPPAVKLLSAALMSPIAINQIHIHPITVLASVHASLKVYLASDHTPLSFGQFSHGQVFTTTRQFVQALTMHYASGALFKAGWVLGSLEILGNPAGLVRSISSGVADLFRLPYEGLIRGPSAFMTGVTSGASSLVKHVSTGTLTSITNFASSISRNMDRLSLDQDHLQRQEEHRRQIPERISEGLKQGLSGFGISLLGAVAGVVDQPIQSWTRSSLPASPTQKATGVISGVGKGLVGVVTKPIGGAAEFVSQTGQGILHGAGLTEIPKPRFAPCTEQVAMATNSHVKYIWKMLQSLPNAVILMYLESTAVTYHGLHHSGCLLLTPQVLFVVSTSEDTQQQAFPVTDITCHGKSSDSGVLCVTLNQPVTPSTAEKKETCNRVADFVDATSGHALFDDDAEVIKVDSSESTSEPSSHGNQVATTTYKYHIDPRFRDTFIALFKQAKDRLEGKGFSMDLVDKPAFSKFQAWHLKAKQNLEEETAM
ncbi:intermembrane lipid transfer protein VPS13B-like [Ptychodera flava]|uniref:intermembrane lipid transfer protein VPS13B-like n=1 Tax=Ptychodera flava TaxID=63121 RepID=UPI00396A43ED